MKNKFVYVIYILLIPVFFYIVNRLDKERKLKTVDINLKSKLIKTVNKISFERGCTHINDSIYCIDGIHASSKFYSYNSKSIIIDFVDIKPDFQLIKKENNDTIFIKKGLNFYYSRITR